MTATLQDTSKKNNKRSLALGSLAGLMALTGVLAFFTDREEATVSATAGTVDLTLIADWSDVMIMQRIPMPPLRLWMFPAGKPTVSTPQRECSSTVRI